MDRAKSQDVQHGNKDVIFSKCVINFNQLGHNERSYTTGGLFASVGQVGLRFGISQSHSSPSGPSVKLPNANVYMKYVSMPEYGFQIRLAPELARENALEIDEKELVVVKREKRSGLKLRFKVGNESLRRLVSGGIAGAVSRSAVAPLETIKTHLMVGSCGHSAAEVFQSIMATDGWKGLYRGNLVNVIRVAPNKAIEVRNRLSLHLSTSHYGIVTSYQTSILCVTFVSWPNTYLGFSLCIIIIDWFFSCSYSLTTR